MSNSTVAPPLNTRPNSANGKMADYAKQEAFTKKLEDLGSEPAISRLEGMLLDASYEQWKANRDANTYVAALDGTKQAALADSLYGRLQEHFGEYMGISAEGMAALRKESAIDKKYTILDIFCREFYNIDKYDL